MELLQQQPLRSLEEDVETTKFNESQILRHSIFIYGGLLAFFIILFSWFRRRFPRVYNVRKWAEAPHLRSHLALDQFGFFSWMVQVYTITDDEIMHECGMDAACFIRLIQMGYRLSLVGVVIMIFLLPIYMTAESSPETESITDRVVQTTVANVPAGSPRLYATVLAAYVLFGYTMYQIMEEFDWYIETRHKFLRKPLARHFAVFVRNIPPIYRDNIRLANFFRQCFSQEDILEATLPINAPSLSKAVSQRKSTLESLEHALALYKRDGVRPQHLRLYGRNVGRHVDSIDYYTIQLQEQNRDVSRRIAGLELLVSGVESEIPSDPVDVEFEGMGDDIPLEFPLSWTSGLDEDVLSNHSNHDMSVARTANSSAGTPTPTHSRNPSLTESLKNSVKNATVKAGKVTRSATHAAKKATSVTTKAAGRATSVATKAAGKASKAASRYASFAVSMVIGGDGEVHSSGFVVFTKQSTTNAALQMIHHPTPFHMEVLEAPDPHDVFWMNVGRTHKDLQVGMMVSIALTIGLCLLWTIPMSFFASLSNASAVRQDVDWLDNLFTKYPGLVTVTEQVAPLLVVAFNALLPSILEWISFFEGPISSGVVQASKFIKLSAFMIIQTFFVSAVSGSIIQAISDIVDDWSNIIDLLANSLPAQGTYFMQILLVSTATTAGWEMLRFVPVVSAFLRRYIGPNLTKKERRKKYAHLRPLCKPMPFEHADFASQLVLYFMVLLVFVVISPMTGLVTAMCFAFFGSMFRNQFIYIYSKYPDSGGQIWKDFIQIILSCMFIAQVTIFGLLSLKKAVRQLPLYLPLMIITVLFNYYLRQKHFQVANHLPTRECLKEDSRRDDTFDFSFLKGAYTQPAMAAARELHPDPDLCIDDLANPENEFPNDQEIGTNSA